ncbi:hypothetical protein [Pleionea sp. CnH1-48]|uniref:hypothetical protein n=1 Tax=Pleionea sp. CnH1-48 TaxID=2954494 RepID=UPI002097C232|nr:hypothetical protein [Pleionea sp. CnH1-48]MCO7224394.1 hypothetical protein [Pleionea sp. CnH1-48]
MGMVYLFSMMFVFALCSLLYWVGTLIGWPYGFWQSMVGAVLVVGVLGLMRLAKRTLDYGFSIALDPQVSIEEINKPDLEFSFQSKAGIYSNEIFEIIPSQNNEIAKEPKAFSEEPERITIHKFIGPNGEKSFLANRPIDKFTSEPVMWEGDLNDIQSAKQLDLEGGKILQAVRLEDDVIVVAATWPKNNWSKSIYILSGNGEVVSTLYQGEDLFSRDRAMESYAHFDDTNVDISYGRLDADEYFVPFMLDEGSYLITYGTDTADYDSFFSTQGYRLPRITRCILLNKENPKGKPVARFTLKDGLPFAVVKEKGKVFLKTLDARKRDNVVDKYYQLTTDKVH